MPYRLRSGNARRRVPTDQKASLISCMRMVSHSGRIPIRPQEVHHFLCLANSADHRRGDAATSHKQVDVVVAADGTDLTNKADRSVDIEQRCVVIDTMLDREPYRRSDRSWKQPRPRHPDRSIEESGWRRVRGRPLPCRRAGDDRHIRAKANGQLDRHVTEATHPDNADHGCLGRHYRSAKAHMS